VQQLSPLTYLPPTTAYRHLTQLPGFTERHLRWILHALSHAQQAQRVGLSRQLLPMLEVQHDRAWRDIVTLDESWFDLMTDHEFIGLSQGERVPKRERDTIYSKKFMLTIVWNPRCFPLINVLEKGRKFNAVHYVIEILSPLSEWRASDATESDRKLVVHADNAQPQTTRLSVEFSEDNWMKTAPHPPYSPNIALSDFFFWMCQRISGRSLSRGRRGTF
jgi:histone-lysine N-methyltransferase SETMAR